MSPEWLEPGRGFGAGASDAVMTDRPLEWYKVVGIELVLFVGIMVPLVYGALVAR